MSKQNLIDTVALRASTSKAEAGRMVDAVLEGLRAELTAGNDVKIVGFGSFSIQERAARTARNPQTGGTMELPAKKVVKFKPGSELAKAVN